MTLSRCSLPAWLMLVALAAASAQEAARLEGQVRDRQGKPVAGARVVQADGRQRVETTTDADGRFQLRLAASPSCLLFVEKAGFRFHGRRCDGAGPLAITLARRDQPAGTRMTTLPPALSRAERKALAARLLEPALRRVLDKGSDEARLGPLKRLARLDAGRLLRELEKRPYKEAWFDSYLKAEAARGLASEDVEEARSIIDSMKDPGFRSMAYHELSDALPAARRADRLALLNQSLLHARAVQANDHRIIHLGWVANRLWHLGEKGRAAKLLREGQAVARELPTAAWAGYARGAFAEDLGLIDVPAALELMKDLKDPFEYVRHHGNLAQKLAGIDPKEAERVLDLVLKGKDPERAFNRDQYAVRVCHRMALIDLARARKIAGSIREPYARAQAQGMMALAVARDRPKDVVALLDRAFELLAEQAGPGKDRPRYPYDAPTVAGLLLPAAERIDPSLVPEFFWRALWLRTRAAPAEARDLEATYTGPLALVLARYDHKLAMVLVEEAAKQGQAAGGGAESLKAAAIADPRRAVALVEALPAGQARDRVRLSVVDMLLAEGEGVWRAVHHTVGLWHVDDDDL